MGHDCRQWFEELSIKKLSVSSDLQKFANSRKSYLVWEGMIQYGGVENWCCSSRNMDGSFRSELVLSQHFSLSGTT